MIIIPVEGIFVDKIIFTQDVLVDVSMQNKNTITLLNEYYVVFKF